MHKKHKAMKMAGLIGNLIFDKVGKVLRPKIKTSDIDCLIGELLSANYAESKCMGQKNPLEGGLPFPAHSCISVNEEIVHGIPGDRVIEKGDLVSVDFVLAYDGYLVDGCRTFEIPPVSDKAKNLNFWTRVALNRAISTIKAGVPWNKVAAVIEDVAKSNGFGVVRDFTGHGIGTQLWQAPRLPNYVSINNIILSEGQTIAVEPMFVAGKPNIEFADDKWTAITKDRSLSSHWESTILVTEEGTEILF